MDFRHKYWRVKVGTSSVLQYFFCILFSKDTILENLLLPLANQYNIAHAVYISVKRKVMEA